jgi:hypothetical protein
LALIQRIHVAPALMVLEFAGAGSQLLHWLHLVAGSSRTILEATDRYAPMSLIEAVGFTPERFTSAEVAAALAKRAAERATALARGREVSAGGRHYRPAPGDERGEPAEIAQRAAPTFGLGLTAAIATDRGKRGEHRCEVAVHDLFGTQHYGLGLSKGARDRGGEERVVSELSLRAIADASGVLGAPLPSLEADEEVRSRLDPADEAADFAAGRRDWLLLRPDGRFGAEVPEGAAILSGSFNPVHHGHLRLAHAASERLGAPVVFELPLVNADKAEISLQEARRRATQFLGRAPLLLTRAPLFGEKASLFPGRTFVVGVDTAARLLEERFYGSGEERERVFDELRRLGARFLVAGRRRDNRFLTLRDLAVPEWAHALFEELPEQEFREDLSSSQLRSEWTDTSGAGS